MSLKNKSCASNPLTPLSGGMFRKIFIGIFAGFLLLNTSVVMAQSINVSWENETPSQIGDSTYFQGLNSFGTVPIQGMSQQYYNYINNWRNYKNVTTTALETKSANATDTSPYVFADEFNTIVGALRGIWNGLTGTEHFFGINGESTDGVRLDVHGEVQLGNFAGFPSSPQAGEIFFNTSDTHFYYYDGTNWRQLDTPDCASCNQAHEYTCVDDSNPNDDRGTWTGGTTNCNSANYDLNYTYYFTASPPPVVCALDSEIDDANCRKGGNAQCSPIVHHYETRCVDGKVKWVDDCGNDTGDVAVWCSNGAGCHDVETSEALPGRTGTCADANNTPCAFDSECVAILGAGATCNNKTHPMHPQYSTGVGFCCDSNNCYTTPCAKDADCNSGLGNGNGWCDISNPQYTGDYTCPDGEKGCGTGSGWADPYDTDNYKYYSNPSSNDEIFYNSPRNPNVKFAGVCNGTLACGSADE